MQVGHNRMRGGGEKGRRDEGTRGEGTWITAQRCTRVYTRFTHTTSSGLSCSSVMNLISSAKPVSDTLKMTKQATRSCTPHPSNPSWWHGRPKVDTHNSS